MAKEIERKFLVTWSLKDIIEEHLRYNNEPESFAIKQGILSDKPQVRIRIYPIRKLAKLTVKGPRVGITRDEFEYKIPFEDGQKMLSMCKVVTEKTRYNIIYEGRTWEVDAYHGVNEGLLTAETEFSFEGEGFKSPPWLGVDVTNDLRYTNTKLATQKV